MSAMNAIEFITELEGKAELKLPPEAARLLPRSGRARVIVLTEEDELRPGWLQVSERSLSRAYAADEPEYTEADLKP